MHEHRIAVRRTARYYTLGGGDSPPAEVWIACHGYGQLARRFLRAFEPVAGPDRLVAAPEALSRFYLDDALKVHGPDSRVGATWMTREDREHEIEDYIAYLDQLVRHVSDGRQRTITALGFSQGAATVSRWAARGSTRIDHVVLWGSPPAHDLVDDELARLSGRLTIAIGTADPSIPPGEVERQDERLRHASVEYELMRYHGVHRVESDALKELVTRR